MATTHGGPYGATKTVASSAGARGWLRPVSVAAAVGAAVVIWTLITRVGGGDLRAPAFQGSASSSAVGLGQVVVVSGLASLAAWGILTLLRQRIRRVRPAWLSIAGVAFLLSLGGPLSGTGVSATDRTFLVLLHVIVGGILAMGLYASLTTKECPPEVSS